MVELQQEERKFHLIEWSSNTRKGVARK